MKSSLLALGILLVMEMATATPATFNGKFKSNGKVTPLGRITVDVIDLRSADGQTRYEALYNNGSTCEYIDSLTIRCASHLDESMVSTAALEKMRIKNKNLSVKFGKTWAMPKQTNNAPALSEWTIAQDVEWNEGTSRTYRYLEMPSVAKLVIPGTSEELWLNTDDGVNLWRFDSVNTTESRWRFFIDYARIELEH